MIHIEIGLQVRFRFDNDTVTSRIDAVGIIISRVRCSGGTSDACPVRDVFVRVAQSRSDGVYDVSEEDKNDCDLVYHLYDTFYNVYCCCIFLYVQVLRERNKILIVMYVFAV